MSIQEVSKEKEELQGIYSILFLFWMVLIAGFIPIIISLFVSEIIFFILLSACLSGLIGYMFTQLSEQKYGLKATKETLHIFGWVISISGITIPVVVSILVDIGFSKRLNLAIYPLSSILLAWLIALRTISNIEQQRLKLLCFVMEVKK